MPMATRASAARSVPSGGDSGRGHGDDGHGLVPDEEDEDSDEDEEDQDSDEEEEGDDEQSQYNEEESEADSEEHSDSDWDEDPYKPRAEGKASASRAGGRSPANNPQPTEKNKLLAPKKECIHGIPGGRRCGPCGRETRAQYMKRTGIKNPKNPNAAENNRRYLKTTKGIRNKKIRNANRVRPSRRNPSNTSLGPLTPAQVTTIWHWLDISPSGMETLSAQLGVRIAPSVAWNVWHRNTHANITATLATLPHHSQWTQTGNRKK